jgi:hypothetical protein
MSTLEKLRGYMYSFQKLSQFSQGRNVVDSSASNTESIPPRDTYVSSPQLKMTICKKRDYLHQKKPKLQEQLLSKNNTILTRKERARCCSF